VQRAVRRARSYGVMGMLECLRAPKTVLGAPAAGGLGLSPSGRGVSLSSSRRNCWLFMAVEREDAVVGAGVMRYAVSEKFHQAKPNTAGCRCRRA
jgi:hypothetical protein